VQDEILTDLARVAELKVISRTSVMQYRDAASRNSRKIGQELGVAHLLEGSVQRVEGKVRVNAQLIDARSDAHLWAQTYDRNLKDVFAIQSEIAETIADQLQAKLSPRERKAIQQPATTDLTAHDLYLRARQLDDLVNVSNSKDGLLEAIKLLEEAVARDPKYFRAYGLMVEVHTDLYWGGFDPTPERVELAKAALQKAEEIEPDAAEVHFAKGTYLYHGLRDYDGARAEFELTQKLLPNFSRVHLLLGSIDRRQGRWDDAVVSFQRAVQADPRDAYVYEEAGFTFVGLTRFAEAQSYLKQAYTLNPKDHFAGAVLSQLPYLERGETSSWRAHLDEVQRAGDGASVPIFFVDCALAERNRLAAEQALTLISPSGTVDSIGDLAWPRDWYVGLVARSFGDKDKARAAFTAAREAALPRTQQLPSYPGGWIVLGLIDAGLSHKSEAIAEGQRACELLPLSKDAWDGVTYVLYLAEIYAWVGEKDLALQELERAKIPCGVVYGDLKMSPKWDALRGDRRFDQILASVAPKASPPSAK
jgi:tetratricopeptide (TPR) repeat protein